MSIDFTCENGVAVLTINRPEKMNAMDGEHYAALSQCWVRVRDDPAIRVAVVTGAGPRAFCAGADLKSIQDLPLAQTWLTQKDQLLNRGLQIWKPVVAAVNGACIGGGMTLMLGTDIRVAVPHATFALAEVKRGYAPGNGGTQRVMAQLPHAIAMQLVLTGEHIDAQTALRWGLINAVVAPEQLMDAALEMANRIAANAPLAVQAAKELLIRSRDVDLETGLRMEVLANRILQSSADAKEGAAAFVAKRPPKFRGE